VLVAAQGTNSPLGVVQIYRHLCFLIHLSGLNEKSYRTYGMYPLPVKGASYTFFNYRIREFLYIFGNKKEEFEDICRSISIKLLMWRYKMETKICKYCGEKKSVDSYEIANIIKGKEYRRLKCSSCYIADKLLRRHKIRDWFYALKKTLQCEMCKENRHYVLEFHHRNPKEKEICLGEAIHRGWSKQSILNEMEKCDVYCANCHREYHYQNNGK